MLLLTLISNPIQFVSVIIALAVALTFHEFAHAWVANRLGDPTAKLSGRLTLNPLAHLDPLGSLFLLIAGFGWGKPVPINSYNLTNPKLDEIKISLAGPFSNMLVAIILSLLMRFVPLSPGLVFLFLMIFYFNIVLMIFNLLPIPPLDGAHILKLFMPPSIYLSWERIGLPILFILLIFSSVIPIIPTILSSGINFFSQLLLGHQILPL